MVWQKNQLAHRQGMKGDIGRIKEEEAHTQAMSSPRKG